MKKETLNLKFQQYAESVAKTQQLLSEYLKEGIEFCGGSVELKDFYKTYEAAEEAGVDFCEQFPVAIDIIDKRGWNHNIYVTRLYKKDDILKVDGYDNSDGEWSEGWWVTDSDNYESLADFIHVIINPSEPEEEKEADESTGADAVLVGYQLVDDDDSFPSEFGCWDVFRSKDDAEAYRQECLDPEEYHVIEEWDDPIQSMMYNFHARIERSFKKGETVWVKGIFSKRFVKVTDEIKNRPLWNNDRIRITELNTGDEWITDMVKVGNIYQAVENSVCPVCGNPLYRGHWYEEDAKPVCINCK